ncbi:amidohydrolase family protein [Actinoplanes bogorensis]|uniref:Amidohydrolase family protein n=1 Tax=Paractinoplanes bogorensis TaxID=1610840 RepID=A0ABS5Z5W2_9ACTN|nr:amidohydrolase family protein [Actinoplanes bogorensis]MBU2670323.1 amidohydrolase family protein [Actinoplanes bogorensis]
MRVDAHHHVWDLAVRDQPWTAGLPALRRTFTFDDLVPALDRNAIDGTILVQTMTVPVATSANDDGETSEMLALARTRPRILGVVGWADLTTVTPDSFPRDPLLVGIRHQVQSEPDPRWLLRPDVQRGLAAVAEAGLVYDLVVTAGQLPVVAETVARLPRLRFVLDHAGKPPIASGRLDPWRAHLTAIARHPNVACKLSGLVTEAGPGLETIFPYARHVLDTFGPDRVMFGSDWPVLRLRTDYDGVVTLAGRWTAGLTAPERAAVFGGTAVRWYRLKQRE